MCRIRASMEMVWKALVFVIVLLFAAPAYGASGKNYQEESFKVTIGGIKARVISSKTLVSGKSGRYSVKNLFDGDRITAWVTGFEKKEIGQLLSGDGHLRVIFDKPVYVSFIRIANGYQKNRRLYLANQRVKEMSVEKVIMGGRSYPFSTMVRINDSMDEQRISMTEGWTTALNMFRTKEIIFSVSDVYGGASYDDLCISEIGIDILDSPGYVPGIKWKDLKKLIDENRVSMRDGWDWDGLNKNDHQFFHDLLHFTLTGNREAYSYFDTYEPEGTGDSEGMTHVFRPAVNETLGLKNK